MSNLNKIALVLMVLISFLAHRIPAQSDPPVSGLEYLGCGYDVFGQYANPISVKAQIFVLGPANEKIDNSTFTKPEHVIYKKLEVSSWDMVSGESMSIYLKKLKNKAGISGKYMAFTASMEVDYSSSFSSSTASFYTKCSSVVRKYTLQLPAKNSAEFNALISPDFRKNLMTMNPKDLFDTYGTHYLWEVVIGARADYNQQTVKKEETSKVSTQIEANAQYNFQTRAGVQVTNTFGTENERSLIQRNSCTTLKVIGGRSEFGQNIFQTGNYAKWVDSIGKNENLVLCDFTGDSLAPIWELCPDAKRKQALEQAYDQYADGKQIEGMDARKCIVGLKAQAGGATISADQGWRIVEVDLNRDAGGKYIFLILQDGLDNQKSPFPITSITAVKGKKASKIVVPPGYEKIDVDLNMGAKGDFIYLCYKRDQGKPPIRDIQVKIGKKTRPDAGYSYVCWWNTNDPADMNYSAGGNFIWVEYTTAVQ